MVNNLCGNNIGIWDVGEVRTDDQGKVGLIEEIKE